MLRFSLAFVAAALLAVQAEAASARENGVNVWRGAAPAGEPSLKGTVDTPPCIETTVVIYASGSPERRLRTQGFWSGDGLTAGMRRSRRPLTQGFYADRMAAGL